MIQIDDVTTSLLDEEWDVLIILDACRYDIFKQVYEKQQRNPGQLKKAKTFSKGTKEWMQNNFVDQDCSDIVYIDPIVMFHQFIPHNTFFKTIMVWEDNWDYEYGTITPEDMTRVALQQFKRYPGKRFIVHYHQPHPPYLLEEYKEFGEIDTPEKIQKNIKKKFSFTECYQGRMCKSFGYERTWRWLSFLGVEPQSYYGQIYKKYGYKGVIDGYKKNLERAYNEVNRLIDKYDARFIVSSDHSHNLNGDLRGLKQQYVPWLEVI